MFLKGIFIINLALVFAMFIYVIPCTSQSVGTGVPEAEGHAPVDITVLSMVDNRETGNTFLRRTTADKATEDPSSPSSSPSSESDVAFKDLPQIKLDDKELEEVRNIGHDDLINNELKRLLQEFGEDGDEVPEVFLREVKTSIRIFQTNPQYRSFVATSLRRSAAHLPFVRNVFTERNIPEDMAYIAFIESGFSPRARSRAGALGMWQFMPGTARNYSLKVSKNIDERYDPVKSTFAAVDYVHDLMAIFGPRSFLLALAAYNCGEGKVISCLKKIDDPFEERHFWHIRSCLPRESREYPPKIIAAAIIGNNPEAFGFSKNQGAPDDVMLQLASKVDERKRRSGQEGLPRVAAVRIDTHKQAAATSAQTPTRGAAKVKNRAAIDYAVKKDNTLGAVAEAFKVDQDDIRRWNKLKGPHLTAGSRLRIYPAEKLEKVAYTVKKGDTITAICDSFKVRPYHVVTCNGIRKGMDIKQGQQLAFWRDARVKPTMHVVKKGSNITVVSKKYHVTVADVMRWNNLESPDIRPQQKLKIYRG